jgi:hypothetical protein
MQKVSRFHLMAGSRMKVRSESPQKGGRGEGATTERRRVGA